MTKDFADLIQANFLLLASSLCIGSLAIGLAAGYLLGWKYCSKDYLWRYRGWIPPGAGPRCFKGNRIMNPEVWCHKDANHGAHEAINDKGVKFSWVD